MHVRRIDNPDKLPEFRSVWEDLLAKCPDVEINLFLSFEWIITWWSHFGTGNELWMLLVMEESRIVGIAPMMVSRQLYCGLPVRMLGFLTNRHTSRSDFIIPENKREVIQVLVQYFNDNSKYWDVMKLLHLPKESGNMVLLETELKRKPMLKCFPVETCNTIYSLPLTYPSWETYYKEQPSKIRKNIRHYQNQLEKADNYKVVIMNEPALSDKSMEQLFLLGEISWKGKNSCKRLSDVDMSFHKQLSSKFSSRGCVDNRFMYINDRLAACSHYLIHNNIAYGLLIFYDDVFAQYSAGSNLIINFIRDRHDSESSIVQLDFNGNSAIGRTWANNFHTFELISACNSRLYSSLISFLKTFKRFITAK